MINERNFFVQPVKKFLRTSDNIWKVAIIQSDGFITKCLLDYQYYYKLIAIDLSKQQKLDADPKVMQQINFLKNQNELQTLKYFSLFRKKKKLLQNFSQRTLRVL